MSIKDFYPLFVIFTSTLVTILLLPIWKMASDYIRTKKGKFEERIDKGVFYLILGVGVYIFHGVNELVLTKGYDSIGTIVRIALSSFNNVCFIWAAPYFKYAPSFIVKHLSNIRKLSIILGLCIFTTAVLEEMAPVLVGINISSYADACFSTVSITLIGWVLTYSFWNRGMQIVAFFSGLISLSFIFIQFLNPTNGNALLGEDNFYIIKYFTFFGYLILIILSNYSWFWEEAQVPELRDMELKIEKIMDGKCIARWTIAPKFQDLIVEHNSSQSRLILTYVHIQKYGEDPKLVSFRDFDKTGHSTNITTYQDRVIKEINEQIAAQFPDEIIEKKIKRSDIFDKHCDTYWLRIPEDNIQVNATDGGVSAVLKSIKIDLSRN